MARHQNLKWKLPEGTKQPDGSRMHSWESIYAALLMDIRDQLQELNRTLGCYRVQRMSDDIHRLDRRIAARISLRPRKRT